MLHIVGFHLGEMPSKDKSIESRSVVARGWRRQWGVTINGYRFLFGMMEMFPGNGHMML